MRNPWLCLTIVVVIGLVALIGTGGFVYLAAVGRDIPQALVAIVSGAVGALSSFLVNPPKGSIGISEGKNTDA